MKVVNLHQEQNEIIQLAIQQNRQAQQRLYAQYAPKMLSVCRQYVKDLQHAEDLMVTGFLKVFTNLQYFEGLGSFEGWIRRIMVNECISHLRVQHKIVFVEDAVISEAVYCEIDSQWQVEELQRLIDALPAGYKMIFILYAVEGYKHKEIAEMLGISEGTSKSQLSQARKMLQAKVLNQKSYQNGIA